MKLFAAVAEQIQAESVRAMFGLMGDGNLKLIPYLTGTCGVPFVGARHEAGAVAMAHGYAQATGEVGVCTFTQGPGLTNALTALVSSRRGRMPMVAISGDTAESVVGLPQDIEQRPIFAACGIDVQEVRPETAHADVAEAFRRARHEHRPIALNLPTDLQEEEVGDTVQPSRRAAPVASEEIVGLAEAIAAIQRAERPVVIGGRGAVEQGARGDLIALADHLGALLATSLPANGWFADHPYNVGIAGGFASDAGRRLISDADCVIAFGASLNHFTSRGGNLFRAAEIVHVDVDPAAHGRFVPTAVGVVGDLTVVARALRDAVPASDGYRTPSVRDAITAQAANDDDESGDDGLDPRALSRTVATMLPEDRTLVVDGGHFMGFPSMEVPISDPSRFVFTLDFGSIGLGVGAAVGAAVAFPDRLTVAAVGDGGLMMSLGELDSAVRYRLPILFLVYNDQAYGAEMHFLRLSGLDDAEARLSTPPLAAVAQAMGMDGVTVTSAADLDAVRERIAAGLDGPLLVDCSVTDRVRAAWLEEAFARGKH